MRTLLQTEIKLVSGGLPISTIIIVATAVAKVEGPRLKAKALNFIRNIPNITNPGG